MDFIKRYKQQIKLKNARLRRIAKMREKGKTDREIAEVLGVSRARVQYLRTKGARNVK